MMNWTTFPQDVTSLSPDVMSFSPDVTSLGDIIRDGTTFSTNNNTNDTYQHIEFYRGGQIAFLVILLLLIIVGNSIVLAAIALSRERRRSRMNFFIMHLALADLLNGPLNVMIDLLYKITMYWYAGNVVCKLVQYTRGVVMYASTFMLVSLSIDRLDAVARPMLFSGSWTRAKLLIGGSWSLSFLFSVPMLALFYEGGEEGHYHCMINFPQLWHWQLYLTVIATSLFIIPAIIICICYVYIIFIIWRSSSILKPQESDTKKARRKSKDEELLSGTQNSCRSDSCTSSRGIIPQAKVRTIKMTFIIVLVFILCWSPYFIFNLCQVYGHVDSADPTMQKVIIFVQSLAPLNSAANPVIYGIFSTRICKYLRRVYIFRRWSEKWCRCCIDESPRATSATEYTSMSETDDIRLTSDPGAARAARVPYVRQKLSEADKEILSMHVTHDADADV